MKPCDRCGNNIYVKVIAVGRLPVILCSSCGERAPDEPPPTLAPVYESQLHELCVALGWQGGTYSQVLEEVRRLAAYYERIKELDVDRLRAATVGKSSG